LFSSCKFIFGITLILFILPLFAQAQTNTERQQEYLEQIIRLQEKPEHFDDYVNYHDETWIDWVERTGALPPDFETVPSLPFLPDPLIIDEGGRNIPVETEWQWQLQRNRIKEEVKNLLSGSFPEPPDSITAHVLEEREENGVKIELIELRFGSDERARLTIELFTPPGEGPFPVFMSQWNHRAWTQIAVRRGYMGLVYAGADSRDDTYDYMPLYPDYDWSTLMRRAWGAHRAVDYLHTLEHADTSKIAITGHSRNAKQALFAAAFDERITAVISSSGGTGGELPYRYTDDRHSNESIDFLMARRTHWFHPGIRFYLGREHKLPIDQNSLMALIAPNAILLSSSIRESGGDPWAEEQMYRSLAGVYEFLDAPDRLGIRLRDGQHGVESRDIEDYMDWLDIQFERNPALDSWDNKLYYDYSFEKWKSLSNEHTDPEQFGRGEENERIELHEITGQMRTAEDWEQKKTVIEERLHWILGDEPPGIKADSVRGLSFRQDYVNRFLPRPEVSNGQVRYIAPYRSLGDYLHGAFYYPVDDEGEMVTGENDKLPVVIYLHRYSNTGYDSRYETGLDDFFEDILSKGSAVLAMDMIGYGQRVEDGTRFYERYPHWSKLGRMVTDTRAAIDALETLDFVDNEKIYLAGYSLGGTVSLLTSALDTRIAGTAVSGAFSPWRTNTEHIEGIEAYSHLYGLLPRLGFFVGHEENIPVDFPEIISMIAPRPLFVISPELDRHADFESVVKTMEGVESVYSLFDASGNLYFQTPYDFNRFCPSQRDDMVNWIEELLQED
jgi:cephalosporin-C deacetylase-like acetyl esterase